MNPQYGLIIVCDLWEANSGLGVTVGWNTNGGTASALTAQKMVVTTENTTSVLPAFEVGLGSPSCEVAGFLRGVGHTTFHILVMSDVM